MDEYVKLFEKYKLDRSKCYYNLILNSIKFCMFVFIIHIIIISFVFQNYWLLFLLLVPLVVLIIVYKYIFFTDKISNKLTSHNYNYYMHNGGLFYISFAQYILEEKWTNCDIN